MGHEDKGLLQRPVQLGDCCHERGEEDRHFHYPRCVPHQDQDQASHKSMCEEHLWQGDQGEGQTSKDSCESLPSCCTQEADLDECSLTVFGIAPRTSRCGNPTELALEMRRAGSCVQPKRVTSN